MTMGLVVQNTSNQSFTLNSFSGSLYSNDKFVANVSSFDAQHIAANSETTLYLKVKLSLVGIAVDIVNAWTAGNIQQKIELIATANVDSLQVPVKLNYTVG